MSTWREALSWHSGPAEDRLAQLAHQLLNGVRLIAGGRSHRLVEVEAYYHSDDHPDAFAHRDPLQRETGRWYFHRTRGQYRSGSFKGLDLTFGDGRAYGGFLLRGLEKPDGELVDGPSLLVDHLLDCTGSPDVPSLDTAIAARPAWDPDSPLKLETTADEGRTIHTCARVGLSLKRLKPTPVNGRCLLARYRFLTEPRRTAKGKVPLVLALHRDGRTPDEINDLTGCPTATIRRYIADVAAGATETDLAPYGDIDLGTKELCRLHGMTIR